MTEDDDDTDDTGKPDEPDAEVVIGEISVYDIRGGDVNWSDETPSTET